MKETVKRLKEMKESERQQFVN